MTFFKKLFHQERSKPSVSEVFDEPWRSVNWSDDEKKGLLETLNNFQCGPKDGTLKILLHGPAGAGKSSFFNSVNNSLKGRITTRALADADSGKGFTSQCKTYTLKKEDGTYFPFTFTDSRGIEQKGGSGIKTADIIKMLQGNIKDGYTFNPEKPMAEDDLKYRKKPSVKDRIHCLVCILPADKISLLDNDFTLQMREIRENAEHLSIPQVIIMTRVDLLCPLVKENIEKIYKSKKIKEKMEECHLKLGVPVTCIFPVKNYHEEDTTNTNMDILILKALLSIVQFAKDYLEDQVENQKVM